MTTMCEIMAKMSRGTINAQDPISKAVTDKFRTVNCFFCFCLFLDFLDKYFQNEFRFNLMIVWLN